MSGFVYKIVTKAEWAKAGVGGVYTGSSDDMRDGFIHFSSAGQVAATAAKHFANQHDLLLVTVPAASLGDSLRWEPSRNGDLFPHLYGTLSVSDVVRVDPIELDDRGTHIFPTELAP